MYQKIINNILQQYLNRFVIAYLNNIIIYSKILKKYISYIFKVLKYLNIKNLYFKSKKYKFYRKKIDFLEFVVKQYRIYIDLEKLQTVKKQKLSTNIKKVQFFLNFINYNKKFIKNYLANTILLTNLTKKNIL